MERSFGYAERARNESETIVVGKRQSEYPTRDSDALDKVLLCENPDPAGDASLPGRPTAQALVTDFGGSTTVVTFADSPYTLSRNNEILLVDTSGGDGEITVPAGWPDNSKFTAVKTTNDDNIVRLTSTETFQRVRFPGVPVVNAALHNQSECFSYVRRGGVWYVTGNSTKPYLELWTVPADTGVNTTESPIPMTFALNGIGSASSLLWSDAGGVLTALNNFNMTVDCQIPVWIELGSNNGVVQVRFTPVTTGGGILNPTWASNAAPRAADLPTSISGAWFLDVAVGDTFQIDGLMIDTLGAGNLVDLGNSGAGDAVGAIITFSS